MLFQPFLGIGYPKVSLSLRIETGYLLFIAIGPPDPNIVPTGPFFGGENGHAGLFWRIRHGRNMARLGEAFHALSIQADFKLTHYLAAPSRGRS